MFMFFQNKKDSLSVVTHDAAAAADIDPALTMPLVVFAVSVITADAVPDASASDNGAALRRFHYF